MSSTLPPGVNGPDQLDLRRLNGDRRPPRQEGGSREPPTVRPGRIGPLPEHLRVSPAGPGDHPSIYFLLQSIFHVPSAAEFQAQLDDPFYEPVHRLVVKRGDKIVAHVRLVNREMYFGPTVLPVTLVSDLATLPEFRRQGCATALLDAADLQMRQDGAVMALLRTSIPQFYLQRGWTVCGRHCFSSARPRDILSYLSATMATRNNFGRYSLVDLIGQDAAPQPLNIRLWRHVERAALVRLYDENTSGTFGAMVRTDAYWRWLISRRGYDRIYVAIDGPDKFELDDFFAPIVGYAAMKEGRIVELMASPHRPNVCTQLLARACGDAIERDYHVVRFDGPPTDPLHQVISLAGGEHHYHEAESGEVFMVKLFDPINFLRTLCPQLHERAKAAALTRPCEFGLLINDTKHRLVFNRRCVKLVTGKLVRSHLTCNCSQLVQLMLGHLNVQDAAPSGRLALSTRTAVDLTSIFFPSLPFWRPPLDDLPA